MLFVELLLLSCVVGTAEGVVGVMMVAEPPGDDATLTTVGRFEDGADVDKGDVTLLVDPLAFLGDDIDCWLKVSDIKNETYIGSLNNK